MHLPFSPLSTRSVDCETANPSEDFTRIGAKDLFTDNVSCDFTKIEKDKTGWAFRLSCSEEGGPEFKAHGHLSHMGAQTIAFFVQRDTDRKHVEPEVFNACEPPK
nr:hypothetical protein [Rhodoblastus acidophilus]